MKNDTPEPQEEMCRENQQVQILNTKENGCPRLANSVLTLRDAVLAYYSCNLACLGLKRRVPFTKMSGKQLRLLRDFFNTKQSAQMLLRRSSEYLSEY